MGYYDKEQFLAAVDRKGMVIETVEKWMAHRENILHCGYTAIIRYGGQLALQHRKHPVFDDVLDLSFSSHPVYINATLQSLEEAIYEGLRREWRMERTDLAAPPALLGKIYYQAEDKKSGFFEHEIDYVYEVNALSDPVAVPEFAYGVHLIKPAELAAAPGRFGAPFAPWVSSMLEARLIGGAA